MGDQAEARRRAVTRAFVRYFTMTFLMVALMSGLVVYALRDAREQRRDSRAIRIEYCTELEKLKTQNREDVAEAKRNYRRNLRLLGIRDSRELRAAAAKEWAKELARNAPKPCPYTAD